MTIISSSESRVFKIVVNVKVSNRVVEIKSFETSESPKSQRGELTALDVKRSRVTCVPRHLQEVIPFTDINRLTPAKD